MAKKRRGSSKAGRPRKPGPRFPSGKLRPNNEPNARVVADRRAMLGGDDLDLSAAHDPLALAHARRWITTADLRTGEAYADIGRRAKIGGPGLANGGIAEANTTVGIDRRAFRDMTDAEVTAVFDQVFSVRGATPEEAAAHAMALWQKVHRALTPIQRRELDLVCMQRSFPFWMMDLVAGRELLGSRLEKRNALVEGLAAVREALHKPKAETPARQKLPPEPPPEVVHGPRPIDVTRYVSPTGELIREVVRIGRRRTDP